MAGGEVNHFAPLDEALVEAERSGELKDSGCATVRTFAATTLRRGAHDAARLARHNTDDILDEQLDLLTQQHTAGPDEHTNSRGNATGTRTTWIRLTPSPSTRKGLTGVVSPFSAFVSEISA